MKIFDEKTENESFSLFVGESGSGKSCAIASYGKLGPVKYVDFDHRRRGILGLRSVLGDDCINNIDFQQYDILNSFSAFDKDLKLWVEAAESGRFPYKTLVLESVNAMETCFMNMVDSIATMSKGIGVATSNVGGIRVYGPSHYKFAATAFRQLRDFRLLKMKGVHVILSCWVVNKWGKPTIKNDKGNDVVQQYADNIVVGKKLLLTEKMGEEVPGCFDDIYEFYKDAHPMIAGKVKHGVRFVSTIAKTSNEKLKITPDVDLTDKCFIDEFQRLTKG